MRKYIICFFVIFILSIMLYSSININSINIFNIFTIYGKNTESSITTDKEANGSDMTELLARLINGEARGEPYEGQVAVGAVILNRVKSPKFPNTIPSVIYQKDQFSCIKDGQFDVAIDENSTVYKAATDALNGSDPTNGALYFYNPSKTKSKWLFSLKTTATIGEHKFALGD